MNYTNIIKAYSKLLQEFGKEMDETYELPNNACNEEQMVFLEKESRKEQNELHNIIMAVSESMTNYNKFIINRNNTMKEKNINIL